MGVTPQITTSSASPASAGTSCARCGQPFAPTGFYQRFCAACRTDAYREGKRSRHYGSLDHVSVSELDRLRLPQNRLEALEYGPEKKCVCLHCGLVLANLSRHTGACPAQPESSDFYRERWQYNKSNPLLSQDLHRQSSQAHKDSPKAQAAREATESIWRPAFTAESQRAQRPNRRGPLRSEARLRRMVERGPRPHRQRISDEALLKIIEKNPFLEEGAKEAGLSPSGFSERAKKLGWNPKDRRRLIVGYLVELRTWVRSQPQVPTVEEIHQHHVGSLRTGTTDLFRRFNRYWSCLEKTLREDPRNIDVLRTSRNGWLAIQLAWKVLKRAHSASTRKTGAPKKSKTNPAAFREEVENTLGRFDKAFAVLAEAKKSLSSSSWAGELRKSGFSDRETFAILASRKPKDAAIRCASERNHIAFKTGQNYYSQESASAK